MVLHLLAQLHAVFLEQSLLRGVDGEVHRSALLQKAQLDGPVQQVIGHVCGVILRKLVALEQGFPIPVGWGQADYVPGLVQLHANLGVDGHVNGGVHTGGLLVQGEDHGEYQAGGQARQSRPAPGEQGDEPALLGFFPQQHRVCHRLPHLIVEVGHFQEPALLVQEDGVTSLRLHDKIAHRAFSPFRTWARWPRMISYPLV